MVILGKQPDNRGEKSLFDFFRDKVNHLEGTAWFNLDLQQINEIDCLAWFRDYGCFVIETKAYVISDFKEISHFQVIFSTENYQRVFGVRPPPWRQAKDAARKLATYLSNKRSKGQLRSLYPKIAALVYFPYISREEFDRAFPGKEQLAQTIIFNDCHRDNNYFTSMLRESMAEIMETEVDVSEEDRSKKINEKIQSNLRRYNNVSEFKNIFNSMLQPTSIDQYDLSLIKTLEQGDFDKEIKSIDFRYPIYRHGYAGAGKTIIALRVLQKLALEGKVVLFTCFNKVLGTEVRRLHKLTYRNEYEYLQNITVNDIHGLISDYSDVQAKRVQIENFDEYFNQVIDRIISERIFAGIFDLIVIDEAQDLKDYGWRLLLHIAKDGFSSLMVLDGREQNLYLNRQSVHLRKFIRYCQDIQRENGLVANSRRKNRIYRNQTKAFLFAQAFLNNYPESNLAIQTILNNLKRMDASFEFVRDVGSLPKIVKQLSNNRDNIRKATQRVIQHCYNESVSNKLGESGILILVPYQSKRGNEKLNAYASMAIEILKELNLDYIDYTIEDNRRLDYLINQVRIVPFHSSRGIESNFTIILGFEKVFEMSEGIGFDYHKLGYIILSRAKFDTWIFLSVADGNENTNKFIGYCEAISKEVPSEKELIYNVK